MSLVFLTNGSGIGSATARGDQVAKELGAKIDIPLSKIHKNDTVIMVKCIVPKVLKRTKKVFCDVADSSGELERKISTMPDISVIVQTPRAIKLLQKRIPGHKIIWIPSSHCNQGNVKRPSRLVKTILFNGRKQGFEKKYWSPFVKMVESKGFDTLRCWTRTRKSCCAAYIKADINVSFRIDFPTGQAIKKNSLKIHNAGSFYVPTVAWPETGFIESYGDPNCFVHVKTLDEMVEQCIRLRDDSVFYNRIADLAEKDASKYHISKVAKWYRKLLG